MKKRQSDSQSSKKGKKQKFDFTNLPKQGKGMVDFSTQGYPSDNFGYYDDYGYFDEVGYYDEFGYFDEVGYFLIGPNGIKEYIYE